MTESLSDRLKSLGVQMGTQNLKPRPEPSRFPIEDVIEGVEIDTPLGAVYQIKEATGRLLQTYTTFNFQIMTNKFMPAFDSHQLALQ